MAALSGALLLWTAGACGPTSPSPSQGDPAETPSSNDQFADDLHLRELKEDLWTKAGPDVRRVHVIVLPEDASVYVDGKQQRRRDGVIELVGKVDGNPHKLRVVKRSQYLEEKVFITDAGASPSYLNLDDPKPSRSGGPRGASSSTASEAGSAAPAAPPTNTALFPEQNPHPSAGPPPGPPPPLPLVPPPTPPNP